MMTLVPALAPGGSSPVRAVRDMCDLAPASVAPEHTGVAAVRAMAGRVLMAYVVFVMLVAAHILTSILCLWHFHSRLF
jgi:type VI protein secretion system component VasF